MEFSTMRIFITSLLLILMLSSIASAHIMRRQRSRFKKKTSEVKLPSHEMEDEMEDFKPYYYQQTLDHFNYKKDSYRTFSQKYVVNTKFWGGAETNSPIFVYLEGEGPLGVSSDFTILMAEAPNMKALMLFIEHRYYGDSIPFVKDPNAFEELPHKAKQLGYLNSEQALADCAEIISFVTKNFSAQHSPVIVHGGSYAGELAFWLRLKYPHIVLGAYASSAPILYSPGSNKTDMYFNVVSKDFEDVSRPCYETIKSCWGVIDEFASKPKGLASISKTFNSCSRLKSTDDLKSFLISAFAGAAQYGYVATVCEAINTKPPGSDIFSRLLAAVVATSDMDLDSCHDFGTDYTSERTDYWRWQLCTELISPELKKEDTMFRYSDLVNPSPDPCRRLFGVPARPHWQIIEYGGEAIKRELKHATSNVIFTNGMRDPYSSGGVLQNISDTIIALPTAEGSHCEDMDISYPADPDWLREQKEATIRIIKGWIEKYNADNN